MRALALNSANDSFADRSSTETRSSAPVAPLTLATSRPLWTLALAVIAALGIATPALAQAIATDLFSEVLAISVMPKGNDPERFSWATAAWRESDQTTLRGASADRALDQVDVASIPLFGRRIHAAGDVLLPLGGERAFYSGQQGGKTEVFYDSDSALFGGARNVEVEPGYTRGLPQNGDDLMQAVSYRGMGNVLASFAALQRESLSSVPSGEASYAPLMWSPTATLVTNTTGLASFVYATGSGSSSAYSGGPNTTPRSVLFGDAARNDPAEPATPDFETYLVIGTVLGLLGLMAWSRQPQQVQS